VNKVAHVLRAEPFTVAVAVVVTLTVVAVVAVLLVLLLSDTSLFHDHEKLCCN
jgi:hypothetical protein